MSPPVPWPANSCPPFQLRETAWATELSGAQRAVRSALNFTSELKDSLTILDKISAHRDSVDHVEAFDS